MIKMMYNQILRREITRQRPVLPFSLRLADTAAVPFSSSRTPDQDQLPPPPPPQSLEDNPFFAKYQQKIKKMLRTTKSVEAEEASASDAKPKQDPIAAGMKILMEKYAQSEKLSDTPIEAISQSRRTSLADVVKVDMIESLSESEISEIWTERHREKEHCIYAVLQQPEYEKLFDLATQYPVFLFPLPKTSLPNSETGVAQGYQLFLSRFKDHTFFLTPLAEYQKYGESATPVLVISHFPELSQEKHIVLMNGNYDPACLNALEVQCLANEIKLFYSGSDKSKLLLLHTLNREPARFNYMDVIKAIESC